MKTIKKFIKNITIPELEKMIMDHFEKDSVTVEFTNLTYLNIEGEIKVYGFIKLSSK